MLALNLAVTLSLSPYTQLISHQYTSRQGLPEGEITAMRLQEGKVYCLAETIYVLGGERWQKAQNPPLTAAQMKPEPPPELKFPKRFYIRQIPPNIDARPQCVSKDAAGHLWIGTSHNIIVTRGDDYLYSIEPEPGGLPYPDVTAIACDPKTGWVWVGFSEGAAVLVDGKWRYFWGRRWLPGNRVNHVCGDQRFKDKSDLTLNQHRSRFGELVSTTALPPDERSGLRWNANPYPMGGGGGGQGEIDAGAFLLAYWLGRYHKLIVEE